MKYLDVTLSQPDETLHPMQRFIREESVVRYEELRAWNLRLGEPNTEYELFYVEADRDPYERRLADVSSVRWYDLTPIGDEAFYVYICQETRDEDLEWRDAFAALNLVVVPPIVYDDSADFTLIVVGDADDLQAMLEGLPSRIDRTVNAIGEFDRRHAPVAEGVTDRQLEAVEAAHAVGFYDVPRTGSIADVAAELDCAESTASTLVQKAEASVMSRVIDRHGRFSP